MTVWTQAAQKLLDARKGTGQDDLHYRAYMRAVLAEDQSMLKHLASKFPGAKEAQRDLIDEAGKAPKFASESAEGTDTMKNASLLTVDYVRELGRQAIREKMVGGCPDNMDEAGCAAWKQNAEEYKDVVKDLHKTANYVGHHYTAPNGKVYADTTFLQACGKLPGVSIEHMGWGEFYADTPKGRVDFDRMRGVEFPEQSGRSHQLYGENHAEKWLVAEMEKHNFSEDMTGMSKTALRNDRYYMPGAPGGDSGIPKIPGAPMGTQRLNAAVLKYFSPGTVITFAPGPSGNSYVFSKVGQKWFLKGQHMNMAIIVSLTDQGKKFIVKTPEGNTEYDYASRHIHFASEAKTAGIAHVLSIGPNGRDPLVNSIYDPILFCMVLSKVMGEKVLPSPSDEVNAVIGGAKMPYPKLLQKAVAEDLGMKMTSAGHNAWRTWVDVGPLYKSKTAGYSITDDDAYFAFIGNKTSFNVDVLNAIRHLEISFVDDAGETHEDNTVITVQLPPSYSPPLTFYQEKAGAEREVVIHVFYPNEAYGAVREALFQLGKKLRFKVEALQGPRKAQTRGKKAMSNPISDLEARYAQLGFKQAGCEKLPEGGMRDNCEAKKEEGAKSDKEASALETSYAKLGFLDVTAGCEKLPEALRENCEKKQDGAKDKSEGEDKTEKTACGPDSDDLTACGPDDGVQAEGCPDNLDGADCDKWEENTEKYKNVVKDQHQAGAEDLMAALDAKWASFGAVAAPENTEDSDKEGKFEEGKPADPTQNMSPEDAAEWKKQTEEHKDQFKSAAGPQNAAERNLANDLADDSLAELKAGAKEKPTADQLKQYKVTEEGWKRAYAEAINLAKEKTQKKATDKVAVGDIPADVERYVKEIEKSNPDYDVAQTWATAWSIYCKHKDPGSDHCSKPSSEYFKSAAADPATLGRTYTWAIDSLEKSAKALKAYFKMNPDEDDWGQRKAALTQIEFALAFTKKIDADALMMGVYTSALAQGKTAGCEKLPNEAMQKNCEAKKEEGADKDEKSDKEATLKVAARPLYEIAREIRKDWGPKVNYGAKPYLEAMADLSSISDNYGEDPGSSIVAYFLSNASSWKGDVAKQIKAELKGMLGGRRATDLQAAQNTVSDWLTWEV